MVKLACKWTVGLVCGFLSVPAQAHDFWIEASKFRPEPGERIELSLMQGMDLAGTSLPYVEAWFTEFVRIDRAGTHPIESPMGSIPAAGNVPVEGTTLIGYQSARKFTELDPETFLEYLHEEGLEHAIEEREQFGESDSTAREYFVRCAKTLLASDGPAATPEVHRSELGFVLELMPEQNPYTLDPGDDLTVQLLYRGEPLAGALLTAYSREDPNHKINVRTPEDGRVQLTLDRGGVWLVKSVKLNRLQGEPSAEWESFWASLVFEIE